MEQGIIIMKRTVVMVTSEDTEVDELDIWQAHQNPGVLHRAISVILWRQADKGIEWLLQQRSQHKPLWPGYWSNTCCTHPMVGESYIECAVRRLDEEMGIQFNQEQLKVVDRFEYQADYTDELSEHELDTVLMGKYSGSVNPDSTEVQDYTWMTVEDIEKDIRDNPEKYTPWFLIIIEQIAERKYV